MDNNKFTVGIDPTNKYEKAKRDLFQALKSCGELSPQERECLMQDFFSVANVVMMSNMLNNIRGRYDH